MELKYSCAEKETRLFQYIYSELQKAFPNVTLQDRGSIVGIGEDGKYLMCYFLHFSDGIHVKFKHLEKKIKLLDIEKYVDEYLCGVIDLFETEDLVVYKSSDKGKMNQNNKNRSSKEISLDNILSLFNRENKYLSLKEIYASFEKMYSTHGYADYQDAIWSLIDRNCIDRDANKTGREIFVSMYDKGINEQKYGLVQWCVEEDEKERATFIKTINLYSQNQINMTTTYKLCFLLAIIENVEKRGDKTFSESIWKLFTRTYWLLVNKQNLRQSNQNNETKAEQIIKKHRFFIKEFDELTLAKQNNISEEMSFECSRYVVDAVNNDFGGQLFVNNKYVISTVNGVIANEIIINKKQIKINLIIALIALLKKYNNHVKSSEIFNGLCEIYKLSEEIINTEVMVYQYLINRISQISSSTEIANDLTAKDKKTIDNEKENAPKKASKKKKNEEIDILNMDPLEMIRVIKKSIN